LTPLPNLQGLKRKAPQLLVFGAIAFLVLILLLDTLEDTLVEGGPFTGTPLDIMLKAILTLTQNATSTVSSWGYAGIFLLMLLESSSLPIPSEVVLPFSGYLVSLGQLSFWLAIIVSTLAGMTGSLVDYYIGMRGKKMLAQRGALDRLLISKTRLETAEKWFNKYGSLAVFLGRMIPGFRTLVSFPAGAIRMPLRKFVVYTTAGCLFWDTILIYIGLYVGVNWRLVAGVSHYLIIGTIAVILVAFLGLFISSRMKTAGRTISWLVASENRTLNQTNFPSRNKISSNWPLCCSKRHSFGLLGFAVYRPKSQKLTSGTEPIYRALGKTVGFSNGWFESCVRTATQNRDPVKTLWMSRHDCRFALSTKGSLQVRSSIRNQGTRQPY
jgi:membrane protein DedA with SNARE-associated domain